jgi:hypothetical protein
LTYCDSVQIRKCDASEAKKNQACTLTVKYEEKCATNLKRLTSMID